MVLEDECDSVFEPHITVSIFISNLDTFFFFTNSKKQPALEALLPPPHTHTHISMEKFF